ncbi:MAG: hypothetical protein ABIM76_01175 [candidate division WOR-3 bacterium]
MPERNYLKYFFQIFLITFLGFIFVYYSGKSIATGNIRVPLFLFLSFLSAAIATSIKTGIYYLFIYIVFMAFIKRFLFSFQGFTFYDPTYLIPDIVIITMFLVVWNKHREKIIYAIKNSFTFKVLLILQIIFFLEIFNPLQGNLMVGIAGSKFLLIPSFLFYISFGIDRKTLKNLLKMLTWLGFISSLYAIYQFHKGFFEFEILWAKNAGMVSLFLGQKLRPFSFFPSPGELSGFLMTAGLIELAMSNLSLGIILTLLKLIVYGIASFYTNIRAGPFIFLFLFPLILAFKITKKTLATLSLYYFILFGILTFISGISLSELRLNLKGVNPVYTEHFFQGIIDPTQKGSSFVHRLNLWKNAIIYMFRNPIGHGIGVSTLAANRFGGPPMHVESTFISMIYSCGIFGFLSLMFLTIYTIFKGFITLSHKYDKIILAVWIGFVSIFMGQWIVTYFQGAFFWLSMGILLRWIDLKEEL